MNLQNKTVAALVAAAVLASWSVHAQVPYRTYVVRPAINNDAILENEPLPAVCRDETVMAIMAARGEYEPASFLVKTDQPLEQVMERVEREHLARAMQRARGNKAAAARSLGLTRPRLYRRLGQLGMLGNDVETDDD